MACIPILNTVVANGNFSITEEVYGYLFEPVSPNIVTPNDIGFNIGSLDIETLDVWYGLTITNFDSTERLQLEFGFGESSNRYSIDYNSGNGRATIEVLNPTGTVVIYTEQYTLTAAHGDDIHLIFNHRHVRDEDTGLYTFFSRMAGRPSSSETMTYNVLTSTTGVDISGLTSPVGLDFIATSNTQQSSFLLTSTRAYMGMKDTVNTYALLTSTDLCGNIILNEPYNPGDVTTLIVLEDGTGVEGANAYVTISEVSDYLLVHDGYGAWNSLGSDTQEKYIIAASNNIDTAMRWASSRLTTTQGLAFPREPFYDNEGVLIEGVPDLIKEAVSIICSALASGEELTEKSISLASESFGNSTDTYAIPNSVKVSPIYASSLKKLKYYGYGRSSGTIYEIFRA